MKYIYRIDHGNQHCYQVIVGRGLKQKKSKAFFDGVYNGKRNALKQAKIYRDNAVKELAPLMELRKRSLRTYGKNISEYWHTTGAWQYLNIKATFYDAKKKKQLAKSFSVNKYGYNEAVKLALEWKREQIETLNA